MTMRRPFASLTSLCALLFLGQACADSPPACPPEHGVAIQVLGSGGPIADDARASSSYLVWVDSKARVMIDVGGGSFLRFGEAVATFTDLDFIGLSHFHTDHSADFPALLKSGYFANRDRPLTVSGPSGNSRFPGLQQYLNSMIGPDSGAYAYLSGYLDGSGGLPPLASQEVDNEIPTSLDLLPENNEISIFAMRVPHGIVPTVAYRIEVGGKSIVFASDQNGSDAGFSEFASNASVLVMHMPIPENADAGARQLHAVPSKIAAIAESAQADTLLLSHFMARSLRSLDSSVTIIDDGYNGALTLAEDLYCQIVR